MTTIASSLLSDRLVKIYVADSAQPFHVQQRLLESTSEYFIRALRPDGFGEGKSGTLRFPEDDVKIWQILLY